MIDTHCHIHDFSVYKYVCGTRGVTAEDFRPEKLVRRAREKGVSGVVCVGTTMADSRAARDFAGGFSGEVKIFWTYGVHPDESEKMAEVSFEEIERDFLELNGGDFYKVGERSENAAVAIGEVGLDFHHDDSREEKERQIALFRKMLRLAEQYRLPVIFHVREAFPEFFRVVDEFREISGVIHSFSDGEEVMQECLERGFYIGAGGIMTFRKKAPLPPLERILLETDAPFLTPVPFRKEVNEPHYVRTTAEFLAGRYGVSAEEIIAQADENAGELFGV